MYIWIRILCHNTCTAATGGKYARGAVGDPELPLAFGNFGSGFHGNDRLLRGQLYDPRIYASVLPVDAVSVA